MKKKLFVGGLSWDTDDHGLRAAFDPFGRVVEAKVINDRDTGKSRGFGFVTFESADAADEAMGAMDDIELDDRRIRVNFAEDKKRDGDGNRRGGGNGRHPHRGRERR